MIFDHISFLYKQMMVQRMYDLYHGGIINESEVIILPFLYRGKFPYTIPYAYALSISI